MELFVSELEVKVVYIQFSYNSFLHLVVFLTSEAIQKQNMQELIIIAKEIYNERIQMLCLMENYHLEEN